jgi:hypothetical protein
VVTCNLMLTTRTNISRKGEDGSILDYRQLINGLMSSMESRADDASASISPLQWVSVAVCVTISVCSIGD